MGGTKLSRKKYSSKLKKEVALEALKERKTVQEIAKEYQISPSQVTRWKSELIEGASQVFNTGRSKEEKQIKELQQRESKLHETIGQLTVETDFLKKKLNQLDYM